MGMQDRAGPTGRIDRGGWERPCRILEASSWALIIVAVDASTIIISGYGDDELACRAGGGDDRDDYARIFDEGRKPKAAYDTGKYLHYFILKR